jgi:hypothetical protein
MRARVVTLIQLSELETGRLWEMTIETRRGDGKGPTASKSWSAPYATVLNAAICTARRHGLVQVSEHCWVEHALAEARRTDASTGAAAWVHGG